MNEELDAAQPAPSEEDELSTTPPNPALETEEEDTGWKMPKPVFRQTSGYLPQGFAKKASQDEVNEIIENGNSASVNEEPVSPVDVEPQPDLHELHESDPGFKYSAVTDKPVKKGGAAKIILTILGLLLALFLIFVFIAVVYYLFLLPSNDTTF